MQPDLAEPAALINLLRQQVILAQVRIMELEDIRDELSPRLADLEKLLAAAQTLADQKANDAAHLEKVRADLQAQHEHQRHMQHVTHMALEEARASLGSAEERGKELQGRIENLQEQNQQLHDASRGHLARLTLLEGDLQSVRAELATRLERINLLDAEQRTIKASRSWRWTAWLRSLERRLGARHT